MNDDLGRRLLELLGEPARVERLAVLELDEADRAAAIGALYRSERGQVLAEVLADVESRPGRPHATAADRGAARGAQVTAG